MRKGTGRRAQGAGEDNGVARGRWLVAGNDRAQGAGATRGRDETPRERGFTLAAVLVIMAIMAIFLTVAVESATFQQKREKEQELIFRGNQIVEAIRLFRARNGRFPLTLTELANAKPRVLRKLWKDPMTGAADWEPVFLGEEGTTVGPRLAVPQPTPTPGIGGPAQGGAKVGPIIGVHSRSCADSIMVYDGRTRYCDWKFFFDPARPFGTPPQAQPVTPLH
jgi:type II secretory pathway pseudopilin PulG